MTPYFKIATNLQICTFIAIVLCLSIACRKNSWYEVKSDKATSIPSSLKDLQALLDNADLMNTYSPALGEIASDGHTLSDSRIALLDPNSRNAYTWSHTFPYTKVADWAGASGNVGGYVRVFYSNVVLDALEKSVINGDYEKSQWENIKGQALFLRARSFYELSQLFAPPYVKSTASNILGIPLRLNSDITIKSIRSTVEQTYSQIISDLLIAKELLTTRSSPNDNLLRVRPTKTAAFGLLARVYLSMEEYENAGMFADSCLKIYDYLLNYNNKSDVDGTLSRPIKVLNREVFYHTTMVPTAAVSPANLIISPSLYNMFSVDDCRKTSNFTRNSSTGAVTFKATFSGSSQQFTGLTTGEMYLIRAESYVRQGITAKAMDDLNHFLKSRWKNTVPFPDFTASDAHDALNQIINERKKELMCRGLRWSDLRRLNNDNLFKVNITRIVDGQSYTLDPNSYMYTFPIPDDVIAASGIPQNPGW